MRMKIFMLPVLIITGLFAIKTINNDVVYADKIFINGKIITVDSSNSIAEAVAVKDGKILAVGNSKDLLELKGSNTIVQDLAGKTMIPGLVDGHSHFMGFGSEQYANIASPPVGPVHTIQDIITTLQQYKAQKKIPKGEWITGFGYDQDLLTEKRHPAKEDLDKDFPDNPVVITHVSGHMLVANSMALKVSGIDGSTPDPAGGVIVRKAGSREPTGLLQESASSLLKRKTKTPTEEELVGIIKEQEAQYASYGITTAQDGYTSMQAVKLLQKAASLKALYIDLVSLPGYATIDEMIAHPTDFPFGKYNNHLKLGGFKLVGDGSPQGKTAFFSKPYLTDVPGCSGDECYGVPTVTQQQIDEAVLKGFKNNIQPYVHCNGDATIDMYIKAVEKANAQLQSNSISKRPVVIHSQFVRDDQLDKYKELGLIPSFFSNHTFFWGDVHIRNLGEQRGYFESPLKTALNKGVIFANHTDYAVTPINHMFLLWTSVARTSRSGKVIGAEQKLTPMEGLRAITINGAYLYYEEKIKGSIEKGKLADFAILSADPLTVPTDEIKDIEVAETIKEGVTIFKRTHSSTVKK